MPNGKPHEITKAMEEDMILDDKMRILERATAIVKEERDLYTTYSPRLIRQDRTVRRLVELENKYSLRSKQYER